MTRGRQPPVVLLRSLGCRLNEAELEEWALGFERLGFRLASGTGPAQVDLVVINTCAVTAEAARKSSQLVRRLRRVGPRTRLVVSGCLASLEPERLAAESGIDLLIGNQDKDRLVELASATLDLPTLPVLASLDDAHPLFTRGRQRAFVKVQDGCRHACTFCVTTLARGAERSRPIPEVVASVNRLAAAGIREVLLTGVHLGGYGRDLGGNLGDLIRALLADTPVARIRLGSLEPWDLPPGFWDLFADARLMPHLHLPMQSGSDAVLRRMARRCKTAEFARLAEQGRTLVPGLNLTTDIIIGFPGESEDEWTQTLDFVATMGFGQIHAFGYSPRAGTRAAELPGRIDPGTLGRRALELESLGRHLRRRVLEAQIGTQVQLVREGASQAATPGGWFGYTPNYLPVQVKPHPQPPPVGDILEVSITGLSDDGQVLSANQPPA